MRPALRFKPATWILVLALTYFTVTGTPLRPSHALNSLAERYRADDTTAFGRLREESQNKLEYQRGVSELKVREGPLDIVRAEPLNIILPPSLAAQSLVYFYRVLWVNAGEDWARMEPKNTLSMEIGNLVIGMVSTDPIPWAFIARFATKMMGATARGFTGTYDIHYADKTFTRIITISLRVIDHMTGLEARSDVGIPSGHKTFQTFNRHDQRRPRLYESLTNLSPKSHNRPRTDLVDGPLGTRLAMQKFHARAILTPVIIASRFLEDFYDMIAMKIETGFYEAIEPLHTFAFEKWDYRLSFFCYHAPIPWAFVQEVAIMMSDYAARGFTPAFEAVYHRADELGRDIFVSISFKVLEEKPPIGGIPGLNER